MYKSTKWCWKCQRELSVQAFAENVTKYDGRQDSCRECRRTYDKVRVQRNRERNLALREAATA